MDMTALREWLLQNGVPSEELDSASVPPVLDDVGNALVLSLENDDFIGNVLVDLMMQIESLQAEIAALKGGA